MDSREKKVAGIIGKIIAYTLIAVVVSSIAYGLFFVIKALAGLFV